MGSCRGGLRQAYYKHKAEAEALVLLERGSKMLIGHATSSCVDGGTPLQRFEVAHGTGITRLQDRKRLTWFLNTVTNRVAANTWSVLTEFVSWREIRVQGMRFAKGWLTEAAQRSLERAMYDWAVKAQLTHFHFHYRLLTLEGVNLLTS